MRRIKVTKWDMAEYLKTEKDVVGYLEAVLEENDPEYLIYALGNVARSKGMTKIARKTGLGRESLYKSLSPTGNPSFATVQKVIAALGLKLSITSL